MELVKYGDYTILYQPQGNDKIGNPLYIVNIFYHGKNVNEKTGLKTDKYGNIKIETGHIKDWLEWVTESLFDKFLTENQN